MHHGNAFLVAVLLGDDLHRKWHALTSELRVLNLSRLLVLPAMIRVSDVRALSFIVANGRDRDDSSGEVDEVPDHVVVVNSGQIT